MTITFFPRFRKHYSLQLRCRSVTLAAVAAAAGSGPGAVRLPPLPVSPPLPDPTAPPHDGTAAAAAGVKGPAAAGAVGSGDLAGMMAAGAAVVCPVTARATFPALMVTDVLRDGVSKQVGDAMLGTSLCGMIGCNLSYSNRPHAWAL